MPRRLTMDERKGRALFELQNACGSGLSVVEETFAEITVAGIAYFCAIPVGWIVDETGEDGYPVPTLMRFVDTPELVFAQGPYHLSWRDYAFFVFVHPDHEQELREQLGLLERDELWFWYREVIENKLDPAKTLGEVEP